ncbi:hypothetical protein HYR99_36155 [Candidatus Poribacteria bacterium]|nr:hypothetical protein [Candidatus Poribacteria bacterium]
MPYYKAIVWVFLTLATVSLIVGILAKGIGFQIFGLVPISYLRFTGTCLLFVIAVSLVELATKTTG